MFRNQVSTEIQSVFGLIGKLQAWSPSLPDMESWNRWAEGDAQLDPFLQDSSLAQSPAVSFLPISLRKKLSAVSKVALYLLHNVLDEQERQNTPVVMASRHGESHTTISMLETIGASEQVSPMSFSRSVHNSTVGLFSIANKNTQNNVALSAMDFSFGMGLIEAVTQLYGDENNVLLAYVYADESVPGPLQGFVTEPPVPYGAALLLKKADLHAPLHTMLQGLGEISCLEFLQYALADLD